MSIDLSEFKDVFFEESADHLAAMETLLLELEAHPEDSERMHAIFRAVHSIKGSAAMFGFDEVVRFAHGFESLLDDMRSARVRNTAVLTGLLLRASDLLQSLVAAAKSEGGPESGGLSAAATALLGEIDAARGGAVTAAAVAASAAKGEERRTRNLEVHFTPEPGIFTTGMDPLFVLRDLAEAGSGYTAATYVSGLPHLDALDVSRCYLRWTAHLATDRGDDEIRDLFAFVEDGAEIKIEDTSPAAALETAPAAAAVPVAAQAVPPGQPVDSPTVRVATAKVDKLVDLVGELVIAQSVASQILEHFTMERLAEMREAFVNLERNTRELQERVMAVRMQPLAGVFSRFPRLVRDLAAQTGKRIALETGGEETELDKGVIERLADPLTHLVRNAVDHGIERPADRKDAGKPEQGVVRLTAHHESGNVIVEVADDGKGLNLDRIRAKAIERGLVTAGENLSEEEIQGLIFRPGFSTAEKVTDVSGRGVGMDVVRRNVEAMSGTVTVHSRHGRGSVFRIKLPLTLAILDGLLVRVGTEVFILPLISIAESIRPRPQELRQVGGGGEVVMVRGQALPLLRLHRMFGLEGAEEDPTAASVVILDQDNRRFALLVDDLLGQQQVVVKSLEAHFRKVDGVMGATILGDGRAALILDVAGLIAIGGGRSLAGVLD
ncbi:MAG: chemotaxis protein CheA [Bryobacterales bacterium]|nr:chemotaxis protein CheA [Bryobacterales bacterium]